MANGVPLPIALEDAQGICQILYATGRTVHPAAWNPRSVREAAAAREAALSHNRV